MIKTIHNAEEIIYFAWGLSQDNLNASYPRKESIIELKEYIKKFIDDDSKNVIASYQQGVLCGICLYFWIAEEKYVQTKVFLIKDDYDQIAEEFINYISTQLAGYEFFITGIPFTNQDANKYFKKKNIACNESSIVTEMYYNSTNLLKDMERFRVLVYRNDNDIVGNIFVKNVRDTAEVFGLFVHEKYENKGIESILINEMLTNLYNEFGAINVYFKLLLFKD